MARGHCQLEARSKLSDLPDREVGGFRISPSRRRIELGSKSVALEPLVLRALLLLEERSGEVVTRDELFDYCWGRGAVGDDSLNRIMAVLRRKLDELAADEVVLERVPTVGYLLKFADETHAQSLDRSIEGAYDWWRLGLPQPGLAPIRRLRSALSSEPRADGWGMLALLLRQAAEYCAPDICASLTAECDSAARRALALDAHQPEALVAMSSVVPLYGHWASARSALNAVLDRHPDHLPAAHDLMMVEMATGRVRSAYALLLPLKERDPLAACLWYKAIYQSWSMGDLAAMDHHADHSIQLWPNHPAIWSARFWTLAFTDRMQAALDMLDAERVSPPLPEPLSIFLRTVVAAKLEPTEEVRRHAIGACLAASRQGPAQALAALFGLCLMEAHDESFIVADAYYLRAGDAPVPLSRSSSDLSVTDQHRRVTQILFTPACARMRADRRFTALCRRTGLQSYWDISGFAPDFLCRDDSSPRPHDAPRLVQGGSHRG